MTDKAIIEAQAHVPATAPDGAGGQWAEKVLSLPEVPLDGTTGSFLFPPINYGPDGYNDYVKFWESAPVSDRALSNLISAYRANREAWIGTSLDSWARKFDNGVETGEWIRKTKPNSDQIRDRHDSARLVELRRLEAERPTAAISAMTARSIAMAGQMHRCSGSLSPDDQERVDAHPVRMARNPDSEPWTVKEIWEDYRLAEIIRKALVDQDLAVADELHELRKHLNAVDII